MNPKKPYDVAIIGAGPGGYVAAIRAAQRGLAVCLIEKSEPGGVCLNWGCIPSKSLIHYASAYHALSDIEMVGVVVDRSGFNYAAVQARSREAARILAGGVAGLLRKNKVELLKATARLAGPGEIVLRAVSMTARSFRPGTSSSPRVRAPWPSPVSNSTNARCFLPQVSSR